MQVKCWKCGEPGERRVSRDGAALCGKCLGPDARTLAIAAAAGDDLPQLLSALEAGALIFTHNGERYAARYERPLGWWVWRLQAGSDEHFVSADYTTCDCKAEKPCKHMKLLKHGGD